MKLSLKMSPIFILALASCGQQTKSNKNVQTSLLVNEGHYRARIIPLNRQLQKTSLTGEVVSKVDSTNMNFQVDIRDLSVSMIHPQYVHYGSRCPSENDDHNSDGIIDLTEAQKTMGPEIIALEESGKYLNNAPQFPRSNQDGELFYLQTFSNDEMKKYFMKTDFKRWSGQAFNVSKMSYLILGVSEDVALPETIKGIAGLKPQTTIPVGCGTFEKVELDHSPTTVTGDKN